MRHFRHAFNAIRLEVDHPSLPPKITKPIARAVIGAVKPEVILGAIVTRDNGICLSTG